MTNWEADLLAPCAGDMVRTQKYAARSLHLVRNDLSATRNMQYVYWRRRAVVLMVGALVLAGVAQLLVSAITMLEHRVDATTAAIEQAPPSQTGATTWTVRVGDTPWSIAQSSGSSSSVPHVAAALRARYGDSLDVGEQIVVP